MRDVVKISKLAKVHARYHLARQKQRLAVKWFAQERRARESGQAFQPGSPLARTKTARQRKHSKSGKQHPDAESMSSSPQRSLRSPQPRQVARDVAVEVEHVAIGLKMKIEVQHHNK